MTGLQQRDKINDLFYAVLNGRRSKKQAVFLFQALNKLGIKYVKDPAGAPGNRTLDRVQYPRETMTTLSGDCDDTSVLLAALLTAVGIESAIVSYPDHVLVMFDTDTYEKNRLALGADADRMISHRGTLWIPVETTMINKGFLEAWTTAAEEFSRAISDGQRVSVIELNEAWKEYAAVSITNPEKEWKIDNLKMAVAEEQKKVREDVDSSWRKAIAAIEGKGKKSIKEQNQLGILYARTGNYTRAGTVFKKLVKEKETPEALNNYACVMILSGDENKALKTLDKALAKKKLPGAAVNRALSYYLKAQNDNDMEGFVTAMREARDLLPEDGSLEKFLGFELTEGGQRAAGEHKKAEKQKLDRRRLKELIRQRVLERNIKKSGDKKITGKSRVMPYGGVRGADPEQVAQIVDLLYWFDI